MSYTENEVIPSAVNESKTKKPAIGSHIPHKPFAHIGYSLRELSMQTITHNGLAVFPDIMGTGRPVGSALVNPNSLAEGL